MKKDMLCEKCGQRLRDSYEKQKLGGGTARFSYGAFKPTVDAQKHKCVGCNASFKKGAKAVFWSNWKVGEQFVPWEGEFIIEDYTEQL